MRWTLDHPVGVAGQSDGSGVTQLVGYDAQTGMGKVGDLVATVHDGDEQGDAMRARQPSDKSGEGRGHPTRGEGGAEGVR